MQLNAEDGGNRQCILVTNNENNICEEVTYERNKRVIQGYTNAKGIQVQGLTNNNLRYYKSDYVGRNPSLKNRRDLTMLATELLCIKEDCYKEIDVDIEAVKCFEENGKKLLVIFDDGVIQPVIKYIKANGGSGIFKVYVFSMGADPYTEDFEEVWDQVELCALPDAIYKAYQHILPKRKREIPIVIEDGVDQETVPDLFSQPR